MLFVELSQMVNPNLVMALTVVSNCRCLILINIDIRMRDLTHKNCEGEERRKASNYGKLKEKNNFLKEEMLICHKKNIATQWLVYISIISFDLFQCKTLWHLQPLFLPKTCQIARSTQLSVPLPDQAAYLQFATMCTTRDWGLCRRTLFIFHIKLCITLR